LDKHLANLKQHIMMQIAAGYHHIEEYRKVSIFKRSVIWHHQIALCLQDFDKEFTDPLANTYDQITAYVAKRLPVIRASADLSASVTTGRAFTATLPWPDTPKSATTPITTMTLGELQCAYSVLEYKHKSLQTQQKRNGKKQKTTNGDKAPPNAKKPSLYCYAHGMQGSHTSTQCKVMAGQPQNFTAEMRKSSNPNQPPGGSTMVREQTQ
jgi:hypothetical protein